MRNPLTLWREQKNIDMKTRVMKNREAILDVMSDNIQGARQCPFLLGNKCLGQMCEHFIKLKSVDRATGSEKEFWRCAHVQTPMLLIELNQNINRLISLVAEEKENAKQSS